MFYLYLHIYSFQKKAALVSLGKERGEWPLATAVDIFNKSL
jgi:hypothetical protein